MSPDIRVVIIGVGAIADLIARSLGELPAAGLCGGSCRGREKGERFAREYGCRWFADFTQMLDEIRPDVAIVCTPSGAHLQPVLECARRGIHILCEKPLEITTDRTRQMIEAARSAGVLLGGMFPLRFSPVMQLLHDTAARGRFGKVATITTSVPWWRDDAYYAPGRWQGTLALDGGGALMNQAIHMIDLMQWVAAATMHDLPAEMSPVEEVFAYTAQRGHEPGAIEVEDSAVVSLRFRSGALGQILAATSMYPGSLRRLLIGGRDGTAEILEDQLVSFRFRTELSNDEAVRQRFGESTQHGGGAANPMAIDHSNHRRNIETFLESVRTGNPVELNGAEAAKAVAIIEACYRSAETGAPVRPLPVVDERR